MKIALLQPDLSDQYTDQRQAYGPGNRPPETGLAVLACWIRAYGNKQDVTILDPRKNIEELAKEASRFDLFGMSDWFSNHGTAVEIAHRAKLNNPALKVVLGGPNASLVAQETLTNHRSIDYVISRDGEEALLALAEEKPLDEIPNVWHRDTDGKARFTIPGFTPLDKMPLWDFSSFQNADERLADYLKAQKEGLDPWLVPPLALFSFRGCVKAMKEGVCRYCTSSETKGRAVSAEKLWDQIAHLNEVYGAEIFYMADDIFTISPRRMNDIALDYEVQLIEE